MGTTNRRPSFRHFSGLGKQLIARRRTVAQQGLKARVGLADVVKQPRSGNGLRQIFRQAAAIGVATGKFLNAG